MNPRWASRITGRFLEGEDTESTPQAIAPERTVKCARALNLSIPIIPPESTLFRSDRWTDMNQHGTVSLIKELYDRTIAVVEYGSGCSENKMIGPTFGLLGPQSDYDGHGWPQTSGHCWTNQVQQRDYEIAMDHYIRMAIGNAPWPIGETMVGIHVHSAREKIYTNSVAHVMNDEQLENICNQ
ncbi:pre-mRNA-splicing factor 18 [Tanacetum coccineum]